MSLVVQPGSKVAEAAATGQTYGMTSAIILYKDGPIRQGDPSDIFMRRIVLPAGFDPAVDNPYDMQYLTCDLADTAIVGVSPHAYPASAYPNGVCLRGSVNVNLFIRRSFDGGATWTTTPAGLGGTGTTYDQVFGVGERVWTVTRTLSAGEFEPARDVSQLTSNKETVLDPRYSPTNIGTQTSVERILLPDGTYQYVAGGLYPDDVRDPSKLFAVFETGDATTVLLGGEADPLDLFGSRATVYGDFWDTEDVFAQGKGLWEERWDWLENKKDVLSGEASIAGSPGGAYLWAVWNEWMEHDGGHVYESDPMFRRLWWDDAVTILADAGMYEAAEGETATLTGSAEYRELTAKATLVTRSTPELFYSWDLELVDPATGDGVGLDFHGRYWNPRVPNADPTVPAGGMKLKLGKTKAEGTSYDWMVVTPEGEIFFRGRCSWAGQGGYEFLVAAVDGEPDLVRAKVWKRNGLNRIEVYDSQPGAADDEPATTPLEKGDVVIETD
ncbi:MAG: hypothetical protein ACOC7L_01615 [Acidobacteriota bacterium]